MTPKRQHHWKSIKEIEQAIDRAKRKIKRFQKICEIRQQVLEDLIKAQNPEDAPTIRRLKDDIRYMQKQSIRLVETRLPKLQRLHAVFSTAILPGVEHDGSVVLEKL